MMNSNGLVHIISCVVLGLVHQSLSQGSGTGGGHTHEKVAWSVETPQWLAMDTYKTFREFFAADQATIRFPHPELRYQVTYDNQQLVLLSDMTHELLPPCGELLQIHKTPQRFFDVRDYSPFKIQTLNSRHAYADYLELRRRNYGSSNEMIMPILFLPTGWPIFLILVFILTVIVVPVLGWFLVHVGFEIASIYKGVIWGPIKTLLRYFVVRLELQNRRWQTFLAPPHYMEPRGTWKLPFFLRNDAFEDMPPELAHKPPTNKIDYTMYILSHDDTNDELDLGMDELEFVDEMLQFRERCPKTISRLLKQKLGFEKFYFYFEEENFSDEDED